MTNDMPAQGTSPRLCVTSQEEWTRTQNDQIDFFQRGTATVILRDESYVFDME
ncbi:hypothetical protein Pan54_05250 [Rubinisphaera italica]|uniref:Uncharacterized protein n=1 Tax=Rubinisphaera italica TaxID=2527969 RepID=A0A5C5XAI7_9PLAN|nr:hypothetical protein Pan54_05250 [Rubinisphaera italica]